MQVAAYHAKSRGMTPHSVRLTPDLPEELWSWRGYQQMKGLLKGRSASIAVVLVEVIMKRYFLVGFNRIGRTILPGKSTWG